MKESSPPRKKYFSELLCRFPVERHPLFVIFACFSIFVNTFHPFSRKMGWIQQKHEEKKKQNYFQMSLEMWIINGNWKFLVLNRILIPHGSWITGLWRHPSPGKNIFLILKSFVFVWPPPILSKTLAHCCPFRYQNDREWDFENLFNRQIRQIEEYYQISCLFQCTRYSQQFLLACKTTWSFFTWNVSRHLCVRNRVVARAAKDCVIRKLKTCAHICMKEREREQCCE